MSILIKSADNESFDCTKIVGSMGISTNSFHPPGLLNFDSFSLNSHHSLKIIH